MEGEGGRGAGRKWGCQTRAYSPRARESSEERLNLSLHPSSPPLPRPALDPHPAQPPTWRRRHFHPPRPYSHALGNARARFASTASAPMEAGSRAAWAVPRTRVHLKEGAGEGGEGGSFLTVPRRIPGPTLVTRVRGWGSQGGTLLGRLEDGTACRPCLARWLGKKRRARDLWYLLRL